MENQVATEPKKFKFDLKSLFLKYSVYIVLIVLFLYFSFASPMFLSAGNIGNFFRQIPAVGILTIAYAMVLITGYVDLSIASIAAFSGTAAAYLAAQGMPAPVVIIAALLIGGVFGAINGILIKKFDLPAFILTLGTNYIIRGLIMFVTNGIYITGTPDWFGKLATTKIFGNVIFSNTIIFFVLVLIFSYIMKNTRFGKYCYAIGSNPEAARLSGIKTDKQVIKVFVIEGMLAAIAGILLMSNLNVGGPNEGQGLDLLAMAASIMGGTQFSGGVGTIGGAIVGIFTLQIFTNGLAIMGVNAFMQQAVTGAVIIFAIIVDYLRRKAEKNS
ncbi:ABC transporter permease [Vagococcus zengguangii]|uniref:ABC transporter permease n=1 Tax=Vagococcus zengguangii TaxID=2571750 RepID=A0A4D7CT36_9ENTE|nr:ABC transporter permease [Vagococcus zengguangii]QCI85606.1 ABC transporter permease [Vagococcus zengguangii]TLG79557.1 ABC transporter permease [Vagococcus zengguangii]